METIELIKDGKNITAQVLNCIVLDNGKKYVVYNLENEENVYISLYNENDSGVTLDEILEEEMKELQELLELESEVE